MVAVMTGDVEVSAAEQDPATPLSEREERELNYVLHTVNDASGAARTAWLFYLALLAYFFVAVSSVDHRDLLLNRPVHLPFLGIDIDLDKFFRFSPIIFLLVHFGVYLQHVLLSRKAEKLHRLLVEDEERMGLAYRTHPARIRVHSYFFTQIYAGPRRSPVFASFLHGMNQTSYVILPVLMFLAFQTNFLAYHDWEMTNWHRSYVIADLFLIFFMRHFMRQERLGEKSLLPAVVKQGAIILTSGLSLIVLAVSWLVITIPGETTDRFMTKLAGVTVPFDYDYSNHCHKVFKSSDSSFCRSVFGKPAAKISEEQSNRKAFFLTAYFFEGEVDYAAGKSTSWFSRNLIVTDRDLSVARTEISGPHSSELGKSETVTTERVKLALRGRDLRFAVFDRSNFTGADFTASNLEGASLSGTILAGTIISCARKPLRSAIGGRFRHCAKLYAARFDGANLRDADLRGGCFNGASLRSADLRGASLYKASLKAADLTAARLNRVVLAEARLQGVKLLNADLTGATLRFAKLQSIKRQDARPENEEQVLQPLLDNVDECQRDVPQRLRKRFNQDRKTVMSDATLRLADLRLANLKRVDLSRAKLNGADLYLAQLQGASLANSDLTASDLSYASLHGADLSGANLEGAILVEAKFDGAVLRAVNLRLANLSRASLKGVDGRFSYLEDVNAENANWVAADFRCSALPASLSAALAGRGPTNGGKLTAFVDIAGHVNRQLTDDHRRHLKGVVRAASEQRRLVRGRKLDSQSDRLLALSHKRPAPDRNSVEPEPVTGCRHSTVGLSPGATTPLGDQLARIVCADVLNAEFVARGIAKRIVDSFAKELPRYQGNPADLLKAIALDGLTKQKRKTGDQSNKTCMQKISSRVLWRLKLAANLFNSQAAK